MPIVARRGAVRARPHVLLAVYLEKSDAIIDEVCDAAASDYGAIATFAIIAATAQAEAAMNRIGRVFLTGLFALMPLLVTVFAIGWVASFLNGYIGPDSWFGRQIVSLGASVGSSTPYVIGSLLIAAVIYLLGLIVDSRIGTWLSDAFAALIGRIPIISSVYDLTRRFTDIVDPKRKTGGITDMLPVWCFFGGEPGAAVLALQVSKTPVVIGQEEYLGIMVPSSPVPVGGALIYVPKSWVRPAEDKMDDVMAVYVSMGVTPPKDVRA